jgi:hypothetical protein
LAAPWPPKKPSLSPGNPPQVTGPGPGQWDTAIDWSTSDLWPLVPGDNQVRFTVAGVQPGTSITAQFYPRYETA